jgi:RNA polymerase sigma-70 factor (ECF subfamily)
MDSADIATLEQSIRAHCDAGDPTRAATVLLEGYGPELLGFLIAHLRDHDAVSEVFSQFTEDLWRGLGSFRWQCPARVWSYTLIRHAASHYIKDVRRRRARHVPLSRAGPLSEIEQRVRTATLTADRSEAKDRIVQLRETLPPDDQMLIILRVNRKLAWKDIARVMLPESEDASHSVLGKEAVRLRKRYQLVKDRLRQLALAEGLVRPSRDD